MITQDEFNNFITITSRLKNHKTEKDVVKTLWDKLQHEPQFTFQDYEYASNMLSSNDQERISYATLTKYLYESLSKRKETDNNISHKSAYKFLNDLHTQEIAKDCMKLINKAFPIARISGDEYVSEMEQLHRKYPDVGFNISIIKLKNRLKGMTEVVNPKTKEIFYHGNYNDPNAL